MKALVTRLSNVMSVISGIVLIVMAAITFADIIMRLMRKPIPGVYELVAYLGLVVTMFALPRASMMKAHVHVDIIIDKMSRMPKRTMRIATRILVFLFMLLIGWSLTKMGMRFIATNTLGMTLRIPYYPIVFMGAFACLVQCMVSIYEIFEKREGANE